MTTTRTFVLRRPGALAVFAAAVVSTVGVLPVFMLGAVAVLVRSDLGFTEVQLGLAVSVFWVVASVSSIPSGRIVERLGARGALALAAGGSATALLGIAAAVSWLTLLPWMVVGGLANAFSQLAANLRLADTVSKGRQGFAFGIKQSAIPGATLVGGAAVPAIALPLGWRWVFAAAAGAAVAVGVGQFRRKGSVAFTRAQGKRAALARAPLVVLGLAGAFGAAAATAMATFLVDYAVTVGIPPGPAGLVLAIGSLAAIVSRISMGWLADRRRGGNLIVVGMMLAVGAAAVAALPLFSTWGALVIVTSFAYAVGWGWPGLFNFAVVRRNPQAPAAATGVTQTGVYIGGVSGPTVFGLLVGEFGYAVAWRWAAVWLVIGAILIFVGRRLALRAWRPGWDATG